jgi:hypothetical protein
VGSSIVNAIDWILGIVIGGLLIVWIWGDL